jgi:DNA-binding CsgD family transcriptional regulator
MRTLEQSDVTGLLSLVAEIAVLDDVRPFPPELLSRLGELFAGAEVSYSELDRLRQRSILAASSEGFESDAPDDDGTREYFRLAHEHPVCSYRTRTDDWTSAHKASDFSSQREFERSEIWNELYRADGIHYWLDVGIAPSGPRTRVFILTRGDADFDERDRLVLDLLQPHLQKRYDDARTAADAADALATLEEGSTDDLSEVVLCTELGVLEFASPKSRDLLATYFGSCNGKLPEGLLAALRSSRDTVTIDREGQRLTVRAARSAGMLILLLGERDARLERLTARQLEILEQVATGATDAAVAAVLGIAAATVKKHLEQIYERLDVHTRTAATALLRSPRH